MKKHIFIIWFIFSATLVQAQESVKAIRWTKHDLVSNFDGNYAPPRGANFVLDVTKTKKKSPSGETTTLSGVIVFSNAPNADIECTFAWFRPSSWKKTYFNCTDAKLLVEIKDEDIILDSKIGLVQVTQIAQFDIFKLGGRTELTFRVPIEWKTVGNPKESKHD